MERVVITGMGAITPVGNDVDSFWNALLEGKNGIGPITSFDVSNYKAKLAAEVKDFAPENYMDKKEARRFERFCQFAIAAAKQALESAKVNTEEIDLNRAGVIIGCGIGGIDYLCKENTKLVERGPDRVSPFLIPMMIGNMASGAVSIATGFKGVNTCIVTACAAGTHSIGEAFRAIKDGYLDMALTGGTESAVCPIAIAGFSNMTALSTSGDPNEASLPFDARRSGFILGEGAGILLIESLTSAKKRGATIIAELCGYGATGDAYHITSPDPEGRGAAEAMRLAVKEAGLAVEDVDYINAHGTGTPLNDKYETAAIKTTFGEYAYKLAVGSTKSMTGHLLGAAGAIEAIATALVVKNDIIPPTINLKEKDPDCDLDYIPNQARKKVVRAALSNSLGFGGHNASVLIKKWSE
jgi:3-oxoacyl-[acyl-carrier-protein] synthase II